MKALVEKINANIEAFKANAEAQVVKGNKAAGARARKAALELIRISRNSARFPLMRQKNKFFLHFDATFLKPFASIMQV